MTVYWPDAAIDQLLGRFFIQLCRIVVFIVNNIEALIGGNRNNVVALRATGDKKKSRYIGNKPRVQKFAGTQPPYIKQ